LFGPITAVFKNFAEMFDGAARFAVFAPFNMRSRYDPNAKLRHSFTVTKT
jgi:hypothetical protein